MDKVEEVLRKAFSPDSGVSFFPIRHHSPACAFHVQRAIEMIKPDCVLIEGPSDTDSLIPFIVESEPPISIYYSCKNGEERQACYYPLLEYSPELAALKKALEIGAAAAFIDLPYPNLASCEAKAEKKPNSGKEAYYDDYFLQRSKYIGILCEKENCRSYSELWEKLFEIPAMKLETKAFVGNMIALCLHSREGYPEELLLEEQCAAREEFMASQIRLRQKSFKKILAVTGGFHTSGIIRLLESETLNPQTPISGEAYLIPYSFEECDMLSGYESGMPYPSYYKAVYDNMRLDCKDSFEKASMLYIVKLAKALRKRKEAVSLSEEAAAYSMCLGLSRLRDKIQPGVYEFLDSIRSSFVKGELNLSTSFVMNEAESLLQGEKIGSVAKSAPTPPIVLDFSEKARLLKLDLSGAAKTSVLDIASNPRHRMISAFMHRLAFLSVPFAKKTYGPDYEQRKGASIVREKWDYLYSGKTASSLIEISHLGGAIEEACENRILKLLSSECPTAKDAAALALKSGVMGLFKNQSVIMNAAFQRIAADNSFDSLVLAAESFIYMKGLSAFLEKDASDSIPSAIREAFMKASALIPSLSASDEKQDFMLAERLKTLSFASKSSASASDREFFLEALEALASRSGCPPSLEGAASALAYESSIIGMPELISRAEAYFNSTGRMLSMSGRFLRGLLLCAKDVIFYSDEFLAGLDQIVRSLPYDEFISLAPDLRLSFSEFTPVEIDQIARKVSLDSRKLKIRPASGEKEIKAAAEADKLIHSYLLERGFVS
ncbi:MAG: DUF5682 family protein [Clostridiales bacterium]|jgi:hypothetical protein|nr:DUF5682 family protein [Clostridiales bacterium]